jgi:site-specific recombinase XerD
MMPNYQLRPAHSKDERERLSGLRNAAMLHLLFSTAARISEILALDISDLRGDHGLNRQSCISDWAKATSHVRCLFGSMPAPPSSATYSHAGRHSRNQARCLFRMRHGEQGIASIEVAAWSIVTHAAFTLAGYRRTSRSIPRSSFYGAPPHTRSGIL